MDRIEEIKLILSQKVKKPDTLLSQFFKDKRAEYEKPQRPGTPRGKPIGFSYSKYQCSLLMITCLRQKDIAEISNTSYGVLRKWNTEKPFKELVENHCRSFALFVVSHIKDKIAENCHAFFKEIESIHTIEKLRIHYDNLRDAHLYGGCVTMNIWILLEKDFDFNESNDDMKEFFIQIALCDFVIENVLFQREFCSPHDLKCKRVWDQRFLLKILKVSLMLNQYLIEQSGILGTRDKQRLNIALSIVEEHIKKDFNFTSTDKYLSSHK